MTTPSEQDKDTVDYIQNLMQGTGASLDYEQLKQELNKSSILNANSSIGSSSSAKGINNSNSNTTSSIQQFQSFLKLNQSPPTLPTAKKAASQSLDNPNVSKIHQSAFFASSNALHSRGGENCAAGRQAGAAEELKRSRTMGKSTPSLHGNGGLAPATSNLGLLVDRDAFVVKKTVSGMGDRHPLKYSASQISLNDLGPGHSRRPSKQEHTPEQLSSQYASQQNLDRLGQHLAGDGFGPLHPSLQTVSRDQRHIPGTLTDTQSAAMVATIEDLLKEVGVRGTTIQHLVAESANLRKEVPTASSQLAQIQSLETSVSTLQAQLRNATQHISGLEASIAQTALQAQSIAQRNATILNSIKEKYYFESPGLEPVLNALVTSYEERIAALQVEREREVRTSHHDKEVYDASLSALSDPSQDVLSTKDVTSPTSANTAAVKVYEAEVRGLQRQLDMATQERDLLRLQLVNLPVGLAAVEDEVDVNGLTTRERMQRDKRRWKVKEGERGWNGDPNVVLKRLGITDYENIGPCIEKIELVIRLIPQMETFIRQINATIMAYNMSIDDSIYLARGSPTNRQTPKLSESLIIIRKWATMLQLSKDYEDFTAKVHDILKVSNSPGSLEVCLVALSKLQPKSPTTRSQDPSNLAIQCVQHIQNLFEIKNESSVIPRMNELFVFWAEVTEGLVRLRECVQVSPKVQPGRVLVHACELIEGLNREARLSVQ